RTRRKSASSSSQTSVATTLGSVAPLRQHGDRYASRLRRAPRNLPASGGRSRQLQSAIERSSIGWTDGTLRPPDERGARAKRARRRRRGERSRSEPRGAKAWLRPPKQRARSASEASTPKAAGGEVAKRASGG